MSGTKRETKMTATRMNAARAAKMAVAAGLERLAGEARRLRDFDLACLLDAASIGVGSLTASERYGAVAAGCALVAQLEHDTAGEGLAPRSDADRDAEARAWEGDTPAGGKS